MQTTPGTRPSLFTIPTFWLILLNIGAWVYLGMNGVDWMSPSPADLTAWGGNLGPYTLTGDWPRLITSMFLHGGALHLGLNMFMLSQIGPLSEAVWGRTRFTFSICCRACSAGWPAPGGMRAWPCAIRATT
mgnify:CR=1 FL=1